MACLHCSLIDMSFEEGLVKNEQRSEKMDPAGHRGLGFYPQWEVMERRAACLHLEIASICSRVSRQPGQKHRSCPGNCL